MRNSSDDNRDNDPRIYFVAAFYFALLCRNSKIVVGRAGAELFGRTIRLIRRTTQSLEAREAKIVASNKVPVSLMERTEETLLLPKDCNTTTGTPSTTGGVFIVESRLKLSIFLGLACVALILVVAGVSLCLQQPHEILIALSLVGDPLSHNIETEMFWETRVFFLLDGQDGDVRSKLTLTNETAARALLPEEKRHISFDKIDKEERTDEYVLLENCAGANEIGFKVRGPSAASGSSSRLELKTIYQRHNTIDDLALWYKSTEKIDIENNSIYKDPTILLNFLAECTEQRTHADVVSRWITSIKLPIKVVRSEKLRRFAFIDNGQINLQEADVLFQLVDKSGGPSGNELSSLVVRSWSVEAFDKTPMLESIAKTWEDRFYSAVQASGLDASPQLWLASYPEMVLLVSELLNGNREAPSVQVEPDKTAAEPTERDHDVLSTSTDNAV
jgi:hypothetical protein